jgi:SAV_6107-like HEPN
MSPDTGPPAGGEQPEATEGDHNQSDETAKPVPRPPEQAETEQPAGPTEPVEPDPEDPARPHPQEADMTASTLLRPPISAAAQMLLDRSRDGLLQAVAARSPAERYITAHLSALRAAAAVLAARGRPSPRGGPRSVWEVLPRIAPELGEWAAFFAATASRRAAVEAGRGEVIAPRAADDLLRDAATFHHLVESYLGLPYQQVLPDAFPPSE